MGGASIGALRLVIAATTMAIAGSLGCSHAKPKPGVVAASRPPRIRLAVLPVESAEYRELADWLTTLLMDAHVSKVDDYLKAQVAIEVVQLSIECVDPSPQCYAAAGRSLEANRLLMAQIEAQPGARRRDRPVKVTVTLFDVDGAATLESADHVFKNEQDALADVQELVDQVVGTPHKGDGPATAARGETR
jgi:hypothetical protein